MGLDTEHASPSLRGIVAGFRQTSIGNPDLKWETTTQKNIGFDLGVLENSLYLSVDYFVKNTSDILLPISLPALRGEGAPPLGTPRQGWTNRGAVGGGGRRAGAAPRR